MENADSFMNVLDVSILPTAPSQSFLSLYTGWCNRSANQQWPAAVTSISLLPAVSALCILQVSPHRLMNTAHPWIQPLFKFAASLKAQ